MQQILFCLSSYFQKLFFLNNLKKFLFLHLKAFYFPDQICRMCLCIQFRFLSTFNDFFLHQSIIISLNSVLLLVRWHISFRCSFFFPFVSLIKPNTRVNTGLPAAHGPCSGCKESEFHDCRLSHYQFISITSSPVRTSA